MPYSESDRIIALAGIYQAALCVRQVARHGSVDTDSMEPCIHSLFQTEADSVAAVFGAMGAVTQGARELVGQLSGGQTRDLDLTRYVVSILKLERVLSQRTDLVALIAEGVEEARAKLDHFPLLHPNLLAHIADVYSRTVSRLQPRIMVQGEPLYLQNPDNQNRIRALLLAGVRAAWLWRQIGGSRWQVLFGRKRLHEAAQNYLKRSQH